MNTSDKERERVLEKERKEAHKRERTELREEARKYDPETVEDEHSTETGPLTSAAPVLHEQQPQLYAHAMTHDISHNEPVSTM